MQWLEKSDDWRYPGITYWYAIVEDFLLGVMPQTDGQFGWFVGQGVDGDAEEDPKLLKVGTNSDAEAARIAAGYWYSTYCSYLPKRERK